MVKKLLILAAVLGTIGCNNRSNNANPAPGGDSTPAAAPSGAASGERQQPADHNAATPNDKAASRNPLTRPFTKTPEYRELTVPAGTEVPITLETAIASDTSRIEDPVRARVRQPVMVNGTDAIPEGSILTGNVTEAQRSGRVKGRARVAFRLTTLQPAHSDERLDVRTALVGRSAPSTKEKDVRNIGIPAGVGAIVGGIVGGGSGAAKGAAIGGSAGTGYVLATRGAEVRLPAGTALTVKLAEPVSIRVPLSK